MRASGKNACYNFYWGWYSSSNGVITYFVLQDLDLNFRGQTFETLLSRKRRELAQSFIDFDICHRMTPLRMADVVLHHTDLNLQGQRFSCYAFAINIVHWQIMSPGRVASTRMSPVVLSIILACRLTTNWLSSDEIERKKPHYVSISCGSAPICCIQCL